MSIISETVKKATVFTGKGRKSRFKAKWGKVFHSLFRRTAQKVVKFNKPYSRFENFGKRLEKNDKMGYDSFKFEITGG